MITPSNPLFIRFLGLFARATKIALCPALLAIIAIGAISASDWPQWRGPFFNGSSDETGLPEKFSQTENVLWTAEMPGEGASTPIIQGNRIFLTSTERTNKRKLHALCLDGDTGKILWDLPAGDSYQRIASNSSPSSPSPIADGQRIYFYFGSGQLMAVDLSGKELWRRDLDKDHGIAGIKYGYSSSPLLYQGRLYVSAIQNPKPWIEGRTGQQESYLLCLDPATGKDIWKQKRPSDAVNESLEAYTTPVPCEVNGRALILTAGGDYVVANDAKSGEEL
ncbi:MAG: PQQ-binding-like beta-propeller repeat protein, partial [Candidatus Sumerlaeota bacterium]|nr:PQQ-binding-like beta-propeller repeat protein [Candidatus Sumerlaeota bacterium]